MSRRGLSEQRKVPSTRRITMRGTRRVSTCLAAVLILITAGVASAQTTIPIAEEQVLYEMIGEFNNSGPASQQYGYLSSVTGLGSVFSGTPKDETTALFTFVTDATTFQVVNHGPFRIVDRSGTTTIYLNNGRRTSAILPASARGHRF